MDASYEHRSGKINQETVDAEEVSVAERIGFFTKIFESPIIDDEDRAWLLREEEGIALFIGLKPCVLGDYRSRLVMEKILEYYQDNPDTPEAEFFMEEIGFTQSFIYHKKYLSKQIEEYRDFLGEEDMPDEVESFMDWLERRLQDGEFDREAVMLGYPPNSVANFHLQSQGMDKIEEYFLRGKEACIQDGWTDESVRGLEVDGRYNSKLLQKHKSDIGLSDNEVLALSSRQPYDSFGFSFVLIPEPKTDYFEKEQKVINTIAFQKRRVGGFLDYLDTWKTRLDYRTHEQLQPSGGVREMVWFEGLSPDYIRENILDT